MNKGSVLNTIKLITTFILFFSCICTIKNECSAAGLVLRNNNIIYQVIDEEAKTVQVGRGDASLYGAKATGFYKGTDTTVNIPDSIKYNGEDYKVVKISAYAFYGCDTIRSVVIGENIKTIEVGAFKGCTAIQYIRWNAKNVDDFTYSSQNGNSNVFTDAGNNSAYGISLTFGNNVTKIPAYAFYTSSSSKQYCANIKSIYFGDNIETIGDYAFAYSTQLTNVSLPASLKNIPAHCFEKCTALSSVTISDGVRKIGTKAFYGCASLESVSLGNNVSDIGNEAFSGCVNANEIYWNIANMGDLAAGNKIFSNFGENSDGISVVFGADVESIPANLFYMGEGAYLNSVKIKEVHFDNTSEGTITIGKNAFRQCRYLAAIEIGGNVTAIGDNAFYGCGNVENIYWDAKNVADFTKGNGVFEGVGMMVDEMNIYIGDGVVKLPNYAFCPNQATGGKNVNVKTVEFLENTGGIEIGDYAFYACETLENIDLNGDSVAIGNYSFSGCSGLKEIIIPDSVTSIGSYAFNGCKNVRTITVGNNVQSIGNGVFNNVGTTDATSTAIYNKSKVDIVKSTHYSGSYVKVYGLFKLEYGEAGDRGSFECGTEAVVFQENSYYEGSNTVNFTVKPSCAVDDPWEVSSVELNGTVLGCSGYNQYTVDMPTFSSVLKITYRKRKKPFYAAIDGVGFDSFDDAIKQANDGDTIMLCHDMILTSPIKIDKSIGIVLSDKIDNVIVRNGVKTDSMIKIENDAEVEMAGNIVFEGNTYYNGETKYPMFYVEGSLILYDGIVIDGQTVNDKGGAIYNKGSVDLNGTIIRNNTATYGAGIYCDIDSVLNISRATITDNVASTAGAGIYCLGTVNLGSEKIIINNNSVKSSGMLSNLFLKNTEVGLADDVCEETSIGLTYSTALSANKGYLTHVGINDEWLSNVISDNSNYSLGCDENGLLFVGYKVTFDGRVSENDTNSEVIIRAANPVTNKLVEMPEIEREGYIFVGWYNGSTLYTTSTNINKSTNLKAKWNDVVAKIGDISYSNLSDAINNVGNNETIELINDVFISSTIVFSRDVNYTIDGNGHTILRTTSNKLMTVSDGTITFIDVIIDGNEKNTSALYITGGTVVLGEKAAVCNCVLTSSTDSTGYGAVYVYDGEFYVDGGSINNNSTANSGGAVYVKTGILWVLYGEIKNNSSSVSGGAIYNKDGEVHLLGGVITGNTCSSGNGGAIFDEEGSVFVSGTPKVTNNYKGTKENNVYLSATNQKLIVENDLVEGANVGITVVNLPTASKNSSGIYEYNDRELTDTIQGEVSDGTLISDVNGYLIVQNGEMYVRRGLFSVVFEGNGGTIRDGVTNKTTYIGEVEYGDTLEELFESVEGKLTKAEEPNIFAYWYDSDSLDSARVMPDTKIKNNINVKAKWTNNKCQAPEINISSGTYYSSQTLIMSIADGYDIYYTTDGSIPCKQNGTRYTDSVIIDDDAVVKAVAVADGYADSDVVTRSYEIRLVISVDLSQNETCVYKGESHNLSATVETENNHTSKNVIWTIVNEAEGVSIDAKGKLTVDECATVETVIVRAQSVGNSLYSDELTIIIKSFIKVSYDLGYEADETIVDSGKYKSGDEIFIKAPHDREGYVFEGWKTDSIMYQPRTSYKLGESDVTFTAVWTKNEVKSITITKDGVQITSLNLNKGSRVSLEALVSTGGNATKNVIWSVAGNESSETKVIRGNVIIAADESSDSVAVRATSAFDETKYAEVVIGITSRKTTVSCFETDTLEKLLETQSLDNGAVFTLPEYERTGYTFICWKMFDDEKNYNPGDTVTVADEDIVFYAKWIKNEVTSISFIQSESNVKVGESKTFKVGLKGEGSYSEDVIWAVSGNESVDTKIQKSSDDGRVANLTVGENETAKKLIVKATSAQNSAISSQVTVVIDGLATKIMITSGSQRVSVMSSEVYLATISGVGTYTDNIVWSITDNKSSNTDIVADGNTCTLMVASDETADVIKIKASLASNEEVFDEKLIEIYGKEIDVKENDKDDETSRVIEETSQQTTQPDVNNKTEAMTEQAENIVSTQELVVVGDIFFIEDYKYMVTSVNKSTVEFCGTTTKTVKSVTVPSTVNYGENNYSVTSMGKSCLKNYKSLTKVKIGSNVSRIGSGAFYGDKKCKEITFKTKKLKFVGKNAFKGIHKKAVLKVPKNKRNQYRKLFKKKGQKSTVKIKT